MLPWKHIHFTGIGGAGMAPIAHLLIQRGISVTGSDLEDNKNITILQKAGAEISIGHAHYIPEEADLLIFSSAIPEDNPEREAAKAKGILEMRRGIFLAKLAEEYSTVIAISGSHGKTTVTTILAHIFRFCGQRPDYIIGGTPAGGMPFAESGTKKIFITEVDESDRTLAYISSTIGVVLNVEDDHSWSAGGRQELFKSFETFADKADKLVYGRGPIASLLFDKHNNAIEMDIDKDQFPVPQPGRHNKHNAAIALKVATLVGLDEDKVKKALSIFQGVKRRCTLHAEGDKHILLEDYAHHPTELQEFVNTLNEAYPEKNKVIIFQPHRFERVKNYGDAFAKILKTCDTTYITPPFSAWNKVVEHGTAELAQQANATYLDTGDWNDFANTIITNSPPEKDTVYAVIGAASIEKIIPSLRNLLRQYELKQAITDLNVHMNLSWSDLTTLSIGSQNPLVVEPATTGQLTQIMKYAYRSNINCLPLGCGSNMVGGDEAYDGIIIRMKDGIFSEIDIKGEQVTAGAGVRLNRLVKTLAENGLGGGEPLIAIPGSVGGSARMNAGAQEIECSDFIKSVKGVRWNGDLWEGQNIEWQYRSSNMPIDMIITQVIYQFHKINKEDALKNISSSKSFRKNTQPGGKSPGCAFRNPGNDSAGRLIDKYGLKNLTKGACSVSDIHANFVVNQGLGLENDYAWLLENIQKTIFKKCGIVLENEVIFSSNRQIKEIKPLNIVVLKGGPSPEREISLQSGTAVAQALRDGGSLVTEIDIQSTTLPELPSDTDIVFPVLHGEFGEDGQVQALLDETNIPYVGTGSAASKITINKHETSKLLKSNGIDTPESQLLKSPKSPITLVQNFPVIVKPNSQGSTIGMSIVDNNEDLQAAIDKAFTVDTQVIIEEYVKGQETTCGLLYGDALPVVEIIPPAGFFDFDAKYTYKNGQTVYNCPPKHIPSNILKKMQDISEKCFKVCNAKSLLRVDMIWRPEEDRIVVLEVNTMPGFTANSLLPKSAKVAGYSFTELCGQLAVKSLIIKN
jgi:UDP-N-acetylenolpyruvoylglucosamine reductase